MCLDLLLRILCKSKLRSLDEGFVQRRLSILWGFKELIQRFFEIPCEGLGVPKQLEMALFGVQKDDFRWEVFHRIYGVLIQNIYPYSTLLAQQPEKDKKKTEPQFSCKLLANHTVWLKNHKRSLIAILRVCIWGFVWVVDIYGFWWCFLGGYMAWSPRVATLIFPLTGSDECAGTHRLLFRCPPVRVALDVFLFGLWVVKQHIGGFPKMVGFPNNPWVFLQKNDHFVVFWGVPAF